MQLLNIDLNSKTVKGQKWGHMTTIMYLASGDTLGYDVCPSRTPACFECCLCKADRGRFDNVQQVWITRTRLFFEESERFLDQFPVVVGLYAKGVAKKEFLGFMY